MTTSHLSQPILRQLKEVQEMLVEENLQSHSESVMLVDVGDEPFIGWILLRC